MTYWQSLPNIGSSTNKPCWRELDGVDEVVVQGDAGHELRGDYPILRVA